MVNYEQNLGQSGIALKTGIAMKTYAIEVNAVMSGIVFAKEEFFPKKLTIEEKIQKVSSSR